MHLLEEKENDRTPCLMIIWEPEEFKKTLLMYGHIDKQPPLTEGWSEGLHPWKPVVRGDLLYGRGSSDDGYAFFLSTLILKALIKFKLCKHKMVLYFETDEESGSKDLVYFLKKYENLSGTPDFVVCLDSGTTDYEHFSSTSTLRGFCEFTLKISVMEKSMRANYVNGIVPDSFRIAREIINDFHERKQGILPESFFKDIPMDKYA